MNENIVGWIAACFALLGSGLLAMNSGRWSRWGFVAFLASNSFWISWALHADAMHILTQNIGFTLMSSYGVYKWFRRDAGDGRRSRFEHLLRDALISFQVIRMRYVAARLPKSRLR